jgi:hypothetical protein
LPDIGDNEQKVYILYGVMNHQNNHIALGASGNYTIDWGDGTIVNGASGTDLSYNYNYDTISATPTADGYKCVIITITPQSGQNLTSVSFSKRHAAFNYGGTQNVLDVKMGSPLLTSLPTSGLAFYYNCFSFTLVSHGNLSLDSYFRGTYCFGFVKYIDIQSKGNSGNITQISNIANANTNLIYIKFNPNKLSFTNMGSAFYQSYGLMRIDGLETTGVTNMGGAFQFANSITDLSFLDTSSATTVNDIFNGCSALSKVPIFNFQNATSLSAVFKNCVALEEVTITKISPNVTTFAETFSGCSSINQLYFDTNTNYTSLTNTSQMFRQTLALRKPPLFYTNNVTNMSFMFYNSGIQICPAYNTGNVTDMGNMFTNCNALNEVQITDFSKVVTTYGNYDGMFSGCKSLSKMPSSMNFPVTLTNISGLFVFCYKLTKYPTITNTSNWTTGVVGIYNRGMFQDNFSMIETPSYDLSGLTAATNIFANCYNLVKSNIKNLKQDHNYSQSFKLNKSSLDLIFENLGIPTATRTLTITGTSGATDNAVLSRTSTTTIGSTTVTCSNTASFVTGMQVTGTGISDTRNVTFQDSGDTVTLAGHGISNGKRVSFATITTTTGIVIYTPYYVVNATTDTFQLSLTAGGSAIALTTDGTGTMIYQTLVTAINPNVSVTIDIPASASGTNSLSYRNLNTQIAVMKRWSVTG